MGRLSGLLDLRNILDHVNILYCLRIVLDHGNILYRRRNILDLRIVKGQPFHIAHPVRSDWRHLSHRPRRDRYPPFLRPVILILILIIFFHSRLILFLEEAEHS